jgi:hypothetical protein
MVFIFTFLEAALHLNYKVTLFANVAGNRHPTAVASVAYNKVEVKKRIHSHSNP